MKKILLFSILLCSSLLISAAVTVSFSNITQNGMTVSWSGASSNIIVVMRASGSPDNPVSGLLPYTGSSSFGSGSLIGSNGSYVVFRATSGSSVPVTNLDPNTRYYVEVWTYDPPSGIDLTYDYTFQGSGNQYTTTTQPTTKASAMSITKIKPTSAFISCTAGNGAYRIFTVRSGSTNNELPVDGTVYTANSNFGSGSIVGSGAYTVSSSTTTGFTVNNLSPGTQYTAAVFEYNGTLGANNYLTSSYTTSTFTTPAAEPTSNSTAFSVTNLSGTSATLNWTNGDGAKRIVAVKQNSHTKTALAFDGTDDYAYVGNPAGVNAGTGSFTLEAWIKTSDAGFLYKTIVGKQNALGSTGYWLGTYGGYIYYEICASPGGIGNTASAWVTSQTVADGAWHHVALVANRTSGLNCAVYIDGVLESSSTSALTATTDNSNNFTIGSRKGTSEFFNGQIDEIRLWNTNRSQANIQSNMYTNVVASNANLYGLWRFNEGDAGGTAVANGATNTGSTLDATLYNYSSTTPANSFTSTSGWVYSGAGITAPVDGTDYNANTLFGSGDAIGNNYVVLDGTAGSVNITGLTPQTLYSVCIYEYNGSTSTINYLTSTQLVGSFTTPTNEPTLAATGLNISPVSPTSVTASWTNGNGTGRAVLVRAGKQQTALAFDGIGDSVSIPHNTVLNSSPFTITAWIKTTQTTSGFNGIVSKYKIGSYNGYVLYMDQGYVRGFFGTSVSNYTWISSGSQYVADGNWHHVAYVIDNSSSKIYVDGVLSASAAWVGTAGAPTTTLPLAFGYCAGATSYVGQLDEVAVWSSALSSGIVNTFKNKSLYGGLEAYYYNLKGYWKLDEGATPSTSITNSALTTLTNGTLYNFASTTIPSTFSVSSGWVLSGSGINLPVDQYQYAYYGNSIFSSPTTYYGSGLGYANYMVYAGTGNSVTVTGLSPNTTYNFSVIEYNGGAGDYNFMTSSYLTGNGAAQNQSTPTITSFSPAFGNAGSQVVITGTNFNTTAASNIVYFGATKATVLSASATQLTVLVPTGATFDPISVNNNALIGYSTTPFIVTQTCASGSITPIQFSAASSITSGGNVADLQVADMDMDGKDDLLAVNDNTNNFSGFRNTSTSGFITFSAPSTPSLRALPSGIAADDIDGDGKLDLVEVNKTTNTITISRSISFSGYVQTTTEVEYNTLSSPQSIAIADFNKDGKPDLVIGYVGNQISVFQNTSSVNYVSFGARQDISLTAGTTSSRVAVGDMDNDGKVDIVAACNAATNHIAPFRNNSTIGGAIAFTDVTDYNVGSSINAIAIGKINNDNLPDVCVTQGTANVLVIKNTTTSSIAFGTGTTLTAFANTPAALALSDIDGDNLIDIVVGYSNNASGSRFSMFENTNIAPFSFSGSQDVTFAGTLPTTSIAVGDFNNDGRNDIALGSNSTTISLFRNNIGGTLGSEPSNPATTLSSSSITTTTATLNWTNALGSTGALVVIKPNADVQVNPIDGTDYTSVANANYGTAYHLGANNKISYMGSGNSVAVTGLSSNTTYRYYVYEYQGTGCGVVNYLTTGVPSGTFTTLNNAPVINNISNPTNICQNAGLQTINLSGINDGGEGNQTISISATSNNTTLIPTVATTYTSSATTGSLSYTPAAGKSGTAIITVTVNDGGSNNNTAVKTFTVTVDPAPPTAIAGSNQLTLCSSTATLGATNPGAGFNGTWSIIYQTPGGLTASIASPTNPTSTVNNIDVGDSLRLRWTVSSGSACTPTTGEVSIKRINCSISADFTANKTTVCAGSSVNFTDLSATQTGSINQWSWNFGDASTSTSQNPSHTYATAGTYTVSLTVTNTLATTAATTKNAFITVTDVPSAANPITGVSPVCAGQVSAELFLTTAVSGATSHAWTLPAGASVTSGDSTINVYIAFANNAVSGNVSVAGKNSCGVGTASTYSVTVKAKPDDAGTISGNTVVCDGSTAITYSVSPISNATNYSWSFSGGAVIAGGNGTNAITVNFPEGVATDGDVTVYGTNANGCGNGASSTEAVIVNTKPSAASSINGSSSITLCPIQTGLSYSVPVIDGATGYLWNVPSGVTITNGQGTNNITVDFSSNSSAGYISVIGQNSCGDGDSAFAAVSINGPDVENICFVTVDSASGNFNKVVWEKSAANVDSFYIYRLVPFGTNYLNKVPQGKAGGFEKVGAQHYSNLSEFSDVLYTTPAADPNAEAATYLITTLDACGNESDPGSAAHTSVFLQSSLAANGWNLAWNAYEGNSVSGYIILRDTTGLQFDSLTTTPNTNYTDILPPSLVGKTIRYRVVTVWNLPCSGPNLKVVTVTVKSASNIKSLLFVGINEQTFDKELRIFPNPATDLLNIQYPALDETVSFTLFDMLGQQIGYSAIESSSTAGKSLTINTSEIPAGVYNLSIKSAKISLLKRIIIQ